MRLMPKQDHFYKRFLDFAALIEEAANEMHRGFAAGPSALQKTAETMEAFEGKADRLGMEMFNALHKSFITPFDPEDMFALIHNLDDVIDGLEDVAHRAYAYRLDKVPETMVKLAAIIFEASKGIRAALEALEDKKDVIAASLALKAKESEVDGLTRTAIARLFAEEKDAVVLLKQKEIYEYFETTGDACAHVATILGRIHIKGG